MKILQIVYSLGNGGAEKFAVEISNELSKSQEVKLCSVKRIEDWMLPPRRLSSQVDLIELDFNKKCRVFLFFILLRLIKRTRPDVVHAHSSLLTFYLFLLSILFKKTIFLQTVHSTITPAYLRLCRYLYSLRFINPKFKNVCVSQTIHKQFTAIFPKMKFVQIDNGIERLALTEKIVNVRNEIKDLIKNTNTKVFIAVGNYSVFKNFAMLASAFGELERRNANVILLIIGSGHSSDQVNFAEIAGMNGQNIHQLGVRDNVVDYLACSDALIMSSTKEGMPLVVLEAMSVGLPVISTPAGGVVDIVEHGINGIIARGFEKKDMLAAIDAFLSLTNEQIEAIKKINMKKFSERFSISQCAIKYVKSAYSVK